MNISKTKKLNKRELFTKYYYELSAKVSEKYITIDNEEITSHLVKRIALDHFCGNDWHTVILAPAIKHIETPGLIEICRRFLNYLEDVEILKKDLNDSVNYRQKKRFT